MEAIANAGRVCYGKGEPRNRTEEQDMSFADLAKERYSVRKFDSRPIEQEKLEEELDTQLEAVKNAVVQQQDSAECCEAVTALV